MRVPALEVEADRVVEVAPVPVEVADREEAADQGAGQDRAVAPVPVEVADRVEVAVLVRAEAVDLVQEVEAAVPAVEAVAVAAVQVAAEAAIYG